MRKNLYFILLAIFAATFMTSCGGDENGATKEVLSEKTYAKVITSYDFVSDHFHEGTCVVRNNGKRGVIDMKGNEIIPCEHSHLSACSDGMFLYGATAEDGWSTVYGFLDKKGNVVVKAEYNDAEDYSDGLALVKKRDENYNYHYAFLNKKGEIAIAFDSYERMEPFSNGLAAVSIEKDKKSLWGYINTKGEVVIAPTYGHAYSFSDNVAVVGKGDNEFVIDTKGEVVFVPEKDMIFIEEEFSEGLMPVAKGKELSVKCGYVNTKGEVVIPFEYDIAEGFIDGTATAIKDKSLMVVLNTKGEIIEQETIDPEDLEEELEDFLDIFF